MSLDSDWSSFASGGGGFSESHKGGPVQRGARARAKDKGLLWLYLLYKVRAQLISQAA